MDVTWKWGEEVWTRHLVCRGATAAFSSGWSAIVRRMQLKVGETLLLRQGAGPREVLMTRRRA